MADTFITVLEGPNASDDATRAENAAAAALVSKNSAESSAATASSAMNVAQASATAASDSASAASDSAGAALASENAALSYQQAAELNEIAAANYATASASSATSSSNSAVQAAVQASVAASYAGGSLTIAHAHTTLPLIIEPEFSRASAAFDFALKRYEYNERRWGANGTMVEEGTTNLLPTGAENFVTGWTNGTGETCTVVDYPINIPGIGDVIAKRITGNGMGSSKVKYQAQISGRANPHTDTVSCWCMLLGSNATMGNSTGAAPYAGAISTTMSRLAFAYPALATTSTALMFVTNATTDILDIVVYAPQVENKSYATSYTPPGTTRAADSFTLPVNAYQKNLLTLNQATGGDTLGDTTGFTAVNGGTLTRDSTEKHSGTGCIKYVSANAVAGEGVAITSPTVIAGKIYADSVYLKGSGTVRIYARGASDAALADNGTDITLTSTWTRYQVPAAVPGTVNTIKVKTTTQQAATIYIDTCQLEEGTTASDWTLPVVDYTNALLNPTAGTIEMDIICPAVMPITRYVIDLFSPVAYDRQIVYLASDGGLYYQVGYNTNIENLNVGPLIPGNKYRIAIRYSDRASIWINGIKKATSTNNHTLSLGSVIGICTKTDDPAVSRLNSYVSNVRISSIARTDTEMAYTGILTPDQYTTYCSECKESISPRPYVKDAQGQAQSIITASDPVRERGFINGGFELAGRGTSFSNPATAAKTLNGVTVEYNGTGQTFVVSQQAATPGQMDVPMAKNFLRYYQSVAPTGQTTNQLNLPIEKLREWSGQKCIVDLYLRSPEAVTLPMIYVYQYFGSGGSTSVAVASIAGVKTKTNMTRYTFQVTMPSVAGKTINAGACIYAQIKLPLNTACTVDIADFDIYPGTFPRPMPRPELSDLQNEFGRYLQIVSAGKQLRATTITTNYIDFELDLKPGMRAVPAISGTSVETTNWKVNDLAGTQVTGFTLALLNAGTSRTGFRLTKTSHGMTNATLSFVTDMLLSAEL